MEGWLAHSISIALITFQTLLASERESQVLHNKRRLKPSLTIRFSTLTIKKEVSSWKNSSSFFQRFSSVIPSLEAATAAAAANVAPAFSCSPLGTNYSWVDNITQTLLISFTFYLDIFAETRPADTSSTRTAWMNWMGPVSERPLASGQVLLGLSLVKSGFVGSLGLSKLNWTSSASMNRASRLRSAYKSNDNCCFQVFFDRIIEGDTTFPFAGSEHRLSDPIHKQNQPNLSSSVQRSSLFIYLSICRAFECCWLNSTIYPI